MGISHPFAAQVKNVALCKGIKHEYREHVYASFKALTLFEFVNGLREELQILSKEEIEVAMREDAMKKGGRAADLSKQRVASIHEGADYVTQEGDTVLHLAIDRWVTALLEKRRLARRCVGNLSSSVKSKSIRLIFGRIVFSRRVLEAR